MSDDCHDENQTQSFVALTRGTEIGHYTIVSRIGAGGMGEVYLAEDTKLNRKVALKFMPAHLAGNADMRSRFTREAQAAAKLDHPNIVPIHEVGEYQGRPFFAMAHIEGKSLREVIKEGKLSIDDAVGLAMQILEGLQEAHNGGIVHRDIKPSNIIIDNKGRPRLVDFGLAMVCGEEKLTKTGSTLGTVGYMSPEQVEGKKCDHRSDLFSVGVILYEMLTGRRPFEGDNEAAIVHAITYSKPEPLARYRRNIPQSLESISIRLIEKDPSSRYQSAAEVRSDLGRLEKEKSRDLDTTATPPSIAVLPFANLSGDPDQEYFCDGMAEEIINALTHVKDLRVVARTSSFAFKGKNADIRDIGRKLNVDHILEGSIRKSGNRVRITGQLIKISDGYHLWSEKYDRNLNDIFEIQDDISSAIAENLSVKLLGGKRAGPAGRHTTEFDTYGLYLRGRWLFDQRTENSIKESIDCYEQVINEDPGFVPAYVGIAYSYCELPQFSSFSQKDAFARAREAAGKALKIDDKYAEAHAAMGVILAEFDWNWSAAEKEYQTAIELNAANAATRFWYALLLLYLGRIDEATRQMKLAQELDPLSLAVNKYLGLIYICAGWYDVAEKTLKNSIALAPGMTYLHGLLGWIYLKKGMLAEAISEFEQEERNAEEVPALIMAWKCIALVAEGCLSEVNDILTTMEEQYRQNRASPFCVSKVHFALGDRNKGFEWLNRALEERDFWLRYLKIDPSSQIEPDDPALQEILTEIGLG